MSYSLKERLEIAMAGPPKVTQAALARACKVKPPSVSEWLSGKTKRLDGENLLKAASMLRVTPEWLAGVSNTMRYESDEAISLSRRIRDAEAEYSNLTPVAGYIRFGLMEGSGSAGYGSVNDDFPEVLRSIDIAEWQVRQQLGFIPTDNRVQLLTVRGNSNYPKIKNGDVVMVDTSQTTYSGDDFYLINLHGFTLIKRLQIMGDGLHIRSTNPEYESEVIPAKMMNDLVISGRILGFAQFRRSEEI
jgi:phage repressor protein C with HTH and peptisase S24 domain